MFLLKKAICHFQYLVKKTNVEYGGSGFNAIFANKLNLFNFNFLKMIREIISFYNYAPSLLDIHKMRDTRQIFRKIKVIKIFYRISYHTNGSSNMVHAFF